MLTQTLIALRPVAELPGLAVEGLVSSQLQENGEEGVNSQVRDCGIVTDLIKDTSFPTGNSTLH